MGGSRPPFCITASSSEMEMVPELSASNSSKISRKDAICLGKNRHGEAGEEMRGTHGTFGVFLTQRCWSVRRTPPFKTMPGEPGDEAPSSLHQISKAFKGTWGSKVSGYSLRMARSVRCGVFKFGIVWIFWIFSDVINFKIHNHGSLLENAEHLDETADWCRLIEVTDSGHVLGQLKLIDTSRSPRRLDPSRECFRLFLTASSRSQWTQLTASVHISP